MRTTLTIDDDLLAVARNIAAAQSVSVGEVISGLVRKGLETPPEIEAATSGFPVFKLPPGLPRITLEDVKRLQDEP